MPTPPTEAQLTMLEVIPRITGSLSILGSLYILRDILWKRKSKKATDRLLVGMSVCDVFASISTPLILSHALPSPMGPGNQATCNAQGFFSQFVTATALYTGCLALTYLLSIQYHWKEVKLRLVEQISHIVILLFVIISGGLSIHLELYNPTPMSCTMTVFPPGCASEARPCSRGETVDFWRLPFRTIPEYAAVTFSTIAMVIIYCNVRQVEEKASQWTFHSSVKNLQNTTTSSGTAQTNTTTDEAVKQVETQSSSKHLDIESNPPSTELKLQLPPPAAASTPQTPPTVEPIAEEESIRQITVPPKNSVRQSIYRKRQSFGRQSDTSTAARGMSREVGIQGICFILAFLLTWTVPTIVRCMVRFGNSPQPGIPWFIALNFFLPLQGFFNFLVYLRPTLRKLKLWNGRKSSLASNNSSGEL
jgi:hypothetical protein